MEVYEIVRGVDRIDAQSLLPGVGERRTRGRRFYGEGKISLLCALSGLQHLSRDTVPRTEHNTRNRTSPMCYTTNMTSQLLYSMCKN